MPLHCLPSEILRGRASNLLPLWMAFSRMPSDPLCRRTVDDICMYDVAGSLLSTFKCPEETYERSSVEGTAHQIQRES